MSECFRLPKSIDYIKQDILLKKQEFYGIRGNAHKLLCSYIKLRLQYALVYTAQSAMKPTTFGVPQGSTVGSSLFNIYINDIVNFPLTNGIILYADNTNVLFQGENRKQLEIISNCWLQELNTWLNVNELDLNGKKTKHETACIL